VKNQEMSFGKKNYFYWQLSAHRAENM